MIGNHQDNNYCDKYLLPGITYWIQGSHELSSQRVRITLQCLKDTKKSLGLKKKRHSIYINRLRTKVHKPAMNTAWIMEVSSLSWYEKFNVSKLRQMQPYHESMLTLSHPCLYLLMSPTVHLLVNNSTRQLTFSMLMVLHLVSICYYKRMNLNMFSSTSFNANASTADWPLHGVWLSLQKRDTTECL